MSKCRLELVFCHKISYFDATGILTSKNEFLSKYMFLTRPFVHLIQKLRFWLKNLDFVLKILVFDKIPVYDKIVVVTTILARGQNHSYQDKMWDAQNVLCASRLKTRCANNILRISHFVPVTMILAVRQKLNFWQNTRCAKCELRISHFEGTKSRILRQNFQNIGFCGQNLCFWHKPGFCHKIPVFDINHDFEDKIRVFDDLCGQKYILCCKNKDFDDKICNFDKN